MIENQTFIDKKKEGKASFLKKLAGFIEKRVLTPKFGDNFKKNKKTSKFPSFNEEINTLDLSQYKKDRPILLKSNHPKISKKSPLFDKFGKRESEKVIEDSCFQKVTNDDFCEKDDIKNRLIFRKREFSAKNPKPIENDYLNLARLLTPQNRNKTDYSKHEVERKYFIIKRKKNILNLNELYEKETNIIKAKQVESSVNVENIIGKISKISKEDHIKEIIEDLKELDQNNKIVKKKMLEMNDAKWRKILKKQKEYYESLMKNPELPQIKLMSKQ